MCAAFDAAHTPQARMGVRGSGPIQAHALEALVAKLVFLIRSLDRAPSLSFDPPTPRQPRGRDGTYTAATGARYTPPLASSAQTIRAMCGRPLRSKRNLQERCGTWSGADMCAAFDAAHTPRAQMGVRGSGPIQAHALDALVAKLVFPIPSLDRCAIPLL